MGYMRHHAIIVSSWNDKLVKKARRAAKEIFPYVSPVSQEAVNGYRSFFVPPDGSKEGWEESQLGDRQRAMFIEWLDTQRYEDGSTCLNWVEVQYGDDEYQTCIIAHSDEKVRR